MNQIFFLNWSHLASGLKPIFFLLAGGFLLSAEPARSRPKTYAINQVSSRSFEIYNDERSIRLELIPGDGSLIKVNDHLFLLKLDENRRQNESRLTQFLTTKFFRTEENFLTTLESLVWSQAWAEDWQAEIEGPRGLAQVILSLVYLNKNARNRREENLRSHLMPPSGV